ncbi:MULTISPECIES: nitrous oxide reductase family maturation protein NosD [Haloferax]|uniref:Right handed beta helix domain-containing protein n=1 Tax=Haloferax marinum TaxID=2666143 RepID=A0A6A8GCR2_9EURY|nr:MULTISPECIES: NosD domain-containing protein [Haloferax]KAB1190778.1 hypothetical protein Hfx1150_17255 [Haloferax sp. CBA1150]MRW98318.1 hypothetical protein [Haloferax marinum]
MGTEKPINNPTASRRAVMQRGAATVALASLGLAGITGTAAAKQKNAIPLSGPTTISSPGYYVLTRDIVGEGTITVEPGVTDVTIDGQGYTLSGDGSVSNGISVGEELGSATKEITIKNIHITDFTRDGVELLHVDGGTIQDVVFSKNTFNGIFWAECGDVTVEGCTFSDNGMASFGYDCTTITFVRNYVTHSGGFTFGSSFALTVRNNDFEHSGRCVWLEESTSDAQILNNRMYKCTSGVVLRFTDDILVRGNRIVANDSAGVVSEESQNVSVEKNQVLGNGSHGIYFEEFVETSHITKNNVFGNSGDGVHLGYGSDTNEIVKNRIFDNTGDGIELENADDNVVRKNVIKRNGGVPLNLDSDSTGNVVEDNKV